MIPLGVIQSSEAGALTISGTHTNLNLKDYFELTNPPAGNGDNVAFIVDPLAVFRSSGAATPSVRTGVWAAGVNLSLVNTTTGTWQGAGGDGAGAEDGEDGGTAFLVEYAITLDNTGAVIAGGGGGGGVADGPIGEDQPEAGGGGGAGNTPGSGAGSSGGNAPGSSNSQNGTGSTGGDGAVQKRFIGAGPATNTATGGDGGNQGQSGTSGSVGGTGAVNGDGGAAGFSIDGFSLVTVIDAGTLIGPTNA